MDKGLRLVRKKKSVSEIADACGIKSQAVSQWDRVPPGRVKAVSKLTGIPPHEIRPDWFDAPGAAI